MAETLAMSRSYSKDGLSKTVDDHLRKLELSAERIQLKSKKKKPIDLELELLDSPVGPFKNDDGPESELVKYEDTGSYPNPFDIVPQII